MHRKQKDLKQLQEWKHENFVNSSFEDNKTLIVTLNFKNLEGYEKDFDFQVTIPTQYPLSHCKVQAKTPIYHPQVYSNGVMCATFTPSNTLVDVVEYIINVVSCPDYSQAVSDVAKETTSVEKLREYHKITI
ncbi:MAG: hypothetical protein MHMPM18_002845 [Marteilia pararefringens]